MKKFLAPFLLVLMSVSFLYAQEAEKNSGQKITVNGLLSSSFSYNLNTPDALRSQFRVFDGEDNTFKIDVIEVVVKRDAVNPAESGFRFDVTAGSSIPKIAKSSGLASGDFDVQQAFVTYIIPVEKGIKVDAGKFTTHVGYELIDGYDGYNDNATRSFVFGYAGPFAHTGVRMLYPFSEKISATVMVINGCDNAIDNNAFKTVGGQIAVAPIAGLNLYGNVVFGTEQSGKTANNRSVIDLIGTYSISDALSAALNVAIGSEKKEPAVGKDAAWSGAAFYCRYKFSSQWAVAARAENFTDTDGARTGTVQKLTSLTVTPEYKINDNCVVRGDFRVDQSDKDVFQKVNEWKKTQPTICFNMIYLF